MNTKKSYLTSNGTRIVIIDGKLCKTIEDFYDTVSAQLNLPDYFGRNLDAFEDILFDLEWVEEEAVHFIILSESDFLNNDLELKQILLDILKNEEIFRIQLSILSA